MIPDDLDPLEQHLLAAFETLAPPAGAPSPADPRRRGALARADREPALRSRGALAPEGEALLLLDRLGRAREQRGGRACAAPHGSRAPPLPLRRLLSRPRGADGPGRRPRRDAGRRRRDRRADRRRPAQGVRQPRAGRDPADLDDRLAPAARDGGGDRDRPGAQARRRVLLARRRRRGLQLRRRVAEPRDRPGGAQHDGACRASASSRAAALRLRGQRDRDQRAVARRVGRERALEPGRPPLRDGRR